MKRIATLFLVLLLLMSAAFAEDAVENDALTAIGDELLDRARTLLSDETYEAMFGFGEDILALRAQWAEEMADEQVRPEVYTHPQFSLLYNLLFALDGAPAPSEEALSEMENGTVLMMANMGMGELGSTYLAAAATLELQAFYALPEDFSDCVLVYHFPSVSVVVECTRESAGEVEFLNARVFLSAPGFEPTLLWMGGAR